MSTKKSYVTVTDQFCGAGGSSLGATSQGAEVRLAMNHWDKAILTHNTNFPNTTHECTDISACNPRRYPSTDILITSPECTAHTLAKGAKRKAQGQADLWGNTGLDPAEERSRATMWDVPRFAEVHDYAIIIVENVVDAALYWRLWDSWLHAMHALGYDHEAVCLNSMFAHPTPQSRDRLYVVFWKRGNQKPNLAFTPAAWCVACGKDVAAVQSWKHATKRIGKYGARNQYVYRCPACATMVTPYYYCAANAIDWSVQGERIGDRAHPLKPRTLERIRYGLRKFSRQAVAIRYDGSKIRPLTDALPTQTGRQEKALVVPPFLVGMHGLYNSHAIAPTGVIPTCVASCPTTALLSPPPFIASTNYFSDRPRDLSEPFPTQTAGKQPLALVTPPMLLGQQSAAAARPVTEAGPVVSTAGGISLITPPFIVEAKNHHEGRPITDPLGTVIAGGNHHYVVDPPPFIAELHNNSTVRGVDAPLATMTGSGAHHGLVQPAPFLFDYYGGRHATHAITDPATTIPGRDNHALIAPHMLVPYYGASPAHDISEPARSVTTHDREALVSIEEMLEECRFRMLQPHEIQAAMAFPADYVVLGNGRERVKQLGNAVTPPVMSLLIERCLATLGGAA